MKVAREKEELTREKANLVVQLTAAERENRAQSEVRFSSFTDFEIHISWQRRHVCSPYYTCMDCKLSKCLTSTSEIKFWQHLFSSSIL